MIESFLQPASLFALGIVLGLKHAFDGDHLTAVATMASKTKSIRKSSQLGALWGAGHTTTLLIAGTIVLVTKFTIPQRLGLSFELIVGAMLVVLGISAVIAAFRAKVHFHPQETDHTHMRTPFLVGMVHGLAGSGALTLLVLAGAPSLFQGILFILVFGAGSTASMLVMGAVFGAPFLLTEKLEKTNRIIRVLAGVLSILFGLVLIYEITVVQGLF